MTVPNAPEPAHRRRFWDFRRARLRLLTAAGCGLGAALFAPGEVGWWVHAVLGWDVGAALMAILGWTVILRADATESNRRAAAYDPGRNMVFAIALAASAFSFFAATVILHRVRALPHAEATFWSILCLTAVALSWALTHTEFAFRYAHLFYRRLHQGGLEFPGGHPPCDIDFAYFAFTIGMCYQVSDVTISSSRIRRAVMAHALLSFVYNTGILALALNVVIEHFGS